MNAPIPPHDIPRTVSGIDWATWTPVHNATLLFVIRADQMLLIRKKRGLGAGKINAPGGRAEPGESPLACATREVQEEVCVTPREVKACGQHYFQFIDGYSMKVAVFSARDCEGEPQATEEAEPFWVPTHAVPYDEMWEDDRLWIPHLLANRPFLGRYVFDGDVMLDHHIELLNETEVRKRLEGWS